MPDGSRVVFEDVPDATVRVRVDHEPITKSDLVSVDLLM